MTNGTDPPPGKEAGGHGCVGVAAIFLAVSIAGAFATLALYVLVVELWELIQVPRDFGYAMILYAPLGGLACGFAAAFWFTRGGPSARRVPVLLGLGLTVALGLLVVFFGLGAVL